MSVWLFGVSVSSEFVGNVVGNLWGRIRVNADDNGRDLLLSDKTDEISVHEGLWDLNVAGYCKTFRNTGHLDLS